MNFTNEQIDRLLDEHDGTHGYAKSFCAICEVMHPCMIWRLAEDVKEGRRDER